MNVSTLVLPNLPVDQAGMRAGGLYWLSCDAAEDADLLARQVLAGLPASAQAVLVCAGTAATALVAPLPPAAGPGRLALYEQPLRRPTRLLRELRADLPRIRAGRPALWLLRLSLREWDSPAAIHLTTWCTAMQQWLQERGSAMLVISDGPAPPVVEPLLVNNACVSGLGQLFRAGAAVHYQQHFWSNALGVSGPHDFLLERDGTGFTVSDSVNVGDSSQGSNDQRLCLAMAEVLQGTPAPSAQWQVFYSVEDLMQRALDARAATVLLSLDSNADIDMMAAHLYRLRKHCGRALKLVVSERAPSLRYQDELLLMASGANLVLPAGTPLLRLLAQLDGIQGQRWYRPLTDTPEAVLKRLRPLDVRGLLPPAAFASAVRQMQRNAQGGSVSHCFLRLHVLTGLTPAQVLGQASFRRFGDIACVANGELLVFLFACAPLAIEPALRNIFALPWKELLAGYESVNNPGLLEAPPFLAADTTSPEKADVLPLIVAAAEREPAREFRPLQPRRLTLASLEWRA